MALLEERLTMNEDKTKRMEGMIKTLVDAIVIQQPQ
jgi:hypothetical protein